MSAPALISLSPPPPKDRSSQYLVWLPSLPSSLRHLPRRENPTVTQMSTSLTALSLSPSALCDSLDSHFLFYFEMTSHCVLCFFSPTSVILCPTLTCFTCSQLPLSLFACVPSCFPVLPDSGFSVLFLSFFPSVFLCLQPAWSCCLCSCSIHVPRFLPVLLLACNFWTFFSCY